MEFLLIDSVDEEAAPDAHIQEALLRKEVFWISNLMTDVHGLNHSHDYSRLIAK